MTEPEIDLYKKAFRILWDRERRPDPLPDKAGMENVKDHTSMVYQALLHTHYCVHLNWWFLPWHRAYLFYFERILQEAVAHLNPTKLPTIPYWNWTDDRDIPSMFRGNFPDNPLGNNRRFYRPSRPLKDDLVGEKTIIKFVDEKHSFMDFGSRSAMELTDQGGGSKFENIPHRAVHQVIGGTSIADHSLGDFYDFSTAAFDPIFWSHHANIDRLWNRWLCIPMHNNPPDNLWHEKRFEMFVDTEGKKLDKTVAEILEATQDVVYLPHGEEPPQCVPAVSRPFISARRDIVQAATVKAAHRQPLIINKGIQISVSLDAAQRKQLATIAAAASDQDDSEVMLFIRGIRLNERQPDLYVRAFLNKLATAATPTDDESYIDYFFIYLAGHRQGHPTRHGQAQIEEFNHALNLTPALRRLQRLRKLNSAKSLEVTLVLLPADDSASAPKPTASLKLPFREAILQISR